MVTVSAVLATLAFGLLIAAGVSAVTGWPLGADQKEDNALPLILLVLCVACVSGATFTPPVQP